METNSQNETSIVYNEAVYKLNVKFRFKTTDKCNHNVSSTNHYQVKYEIANHTPTTTITHPRSGTSQISYRTRCKTW